ncbi:VOC family protein [Chitinophaga agri]|uniref:VOC family protein n=1 Tax=Chitinophaga agri TaxID=2703787 RepID=A0A6B9ZFS7_9BACT|nr:VOC family protein [Chitinophaga agri]QHS59945.1 VOC family protein [Chitinophaga agri]
MSVNKQNISTVPAGYTAVTPWIISPDTDKMIAFLTAVFDGEEVPNSRITRDDGKIIHVVVRIGDAMVMLFDAREGWGATPTFLNLYVKDVEKAYRNALSLGATSVTAITPLWFGEKVCRVLDPFGNLLWINERTADVDFTDAKVAQRAASPEAINGIAYIQQSLEEAFKIRRTFLAC